ncbi:MAG: hypothetical protein AAGI07_00110 [Bacteroidota bacterium]
MLKNIIFRYSVGHLPRKKLDPGIYRYYFQAPFPRHLYCEERSLSYEMANMWEMSRPWCFDMTTRSVSFHLYHWQYGT